MNRCDNCKYYRGVPTQDGRAGGLCFFNPPTPVPIVGKNGAMQVHPMLPPTAADAFCSKHEIGIARAS